MAQGRKRKIALITFVVLLAVAFAGFVALVLDSQSNRVRVTISKETTYITEPLRPDGYPDYVGYLNRRLSEGITPENNSAVLFWRAVGPKPIKPELRARFFQMLGIPVPPEKGDYFIDSAEFKPAFIARLKKEGKAAADQSEADFDQQYYGQQTESMRRPWSKEEFPEWAAWLAANEKPLALLVEASKRPRRYDPLIGGDPDHEMVYDLLLFGPYCTRDVQRALCARAMLRLNEGRVDDAWQDLLATHRLARLVSQGFTLVEQLVAVTIDGMAGQGDRAIAEFGKLPSARLLAMRDELAKLPPLPKMDEIINEGERFMLLDYVVMMARVGPGKVSELTGGASIEKDAMQRLFETLGKSTVNWDLILQMGNSWFDRIVEAMKKPTRAERKAAIEDFDYELKQLSASTGNIKSFVFSLLTGPRKAISQRVGQTIVCMMMSSWQAIAAVDDQARIRFDLTLLSFALAAYRADNGAYPETLEQLKPKYTTELPKDIFNNDAPLQYSRTKDGYLLYSFGRNGRDDGGHGQDEDPVIGDSDDLAVRVPSERKKPEEAK